MGFNELPRERVEEVVVLVDFSDPDVLIERLPTPIDSEEFIRFCFFFSFKICGIPSHLELTFGTVGGSFADETPGRPTAVARPFLLVPFLRI